MSPGTQADGSPLEGDLATPSADAGTPNSSSPGKRRGPRSSTSKFRGVSCYKRCAACRSRVRRENSLARLHRASCSTGRWESHIWSNGKQVHLGSFRAPEEAARYVALLAAATSPSHASSRYRLSAYDKAAIMFRGWDAETNAPTEVRVLLRLGYLACADAGVIALSVLPRRRGPCVSHAERHHRRVHSVAATVRAARAPRRMCLDM